MRVLGGMRKVMAVASGGGHWVELRRLMPAFAGSEVLYVSTDPRPTPTSRRRATTAVTNVTRKSRLAFAATIREILAIVRARAPGGGGDDRRGAGLRRLVLAKLLCGSRTVWIDTVAYTEGMTLSGRLARPFADAWLVQWPHLAKPGGPEYWGRCCDRPGGAP